LTDRYALDVITHIVLGPNHCTQSVEQPSGPENDLLMELKQLQFVGPFRIRFPRAFWCLSQLLGRLMSRRLGYLLANDKLAAWSLAPMSAAMNDPLLFSGSNSLLKRLLQLQHQQQKQHQQQRDSIRDFDIEYIAAEVLD